MLKPIVHGAHAMARALRMVGGLTTGLRLGRVVRDARLPYLRN